MILPIQRMRLRTRPLPVPMRRLNKWQTSAATLRIRHPGPAIPIRKASKPMLLMRPTLTPPLVTPVRST